MQIIKKLSKFLNKKNNNEENLYKNHWLWNSRIPENYTEQDVFLVSYPKSGNTYLRFLLGNAIKLLFQIDREVNFFTLQDIIPWISEKSLLPTGPFGRIDLPRIIKSHYAYNPHYKRTILLVRDPRDVMVSYYYYCKSQDGFNIPDDWTISEFIRSEEYRPKVWADHTKSWYFGFQHVDKNLQLFRYEDFLSHPHESLNRLMKLLGFQMEKQALDKAICLSSKENMKKSELTTMPTRLVKEQNVSFVRKAKANFGEELNPEDKKLIEHETRDIAAIVGYNY